MSAQAPSSIREFAEGSPSREQPAAHVQESRFGIWFQGTWMWTTYVLRPAFDDLERLLLNRCATYPVIVDVGCGFGRSFKMLHDRFKPNRMIGIDIDPQMLEHSGLEARRTGITVELKRASSSSLPLASQSVDMIFCHQTFHHMVEQHRALGEFHRVLKPEGVLLFAESTRKYIDSWIIRLLFRHPMEVQRTALEYLAMIRGAGFAIDPRAISYPYLWWSRSDFAIGEKWFGIRPAENREETMVNLVAVRV